MSTLPQSFITEVTRQLKTAVAVTESPFSFAQQVQDFGGERWVVDINLLVEGLAFEAFANSVINKKRIFDLKMPKAGRKDMAAAAITVRGASQIGNSLNVEGDWSGRPLKAGDFFSLGGAGSYSLHQLTEDAEPDGMGRATLRFVPKLRQSPAASMAVEVAAPMVSLRATTTAPASIGYRLHQFSIRAVEAL